MASKELFFFFFLFLLSGLDVFFSEAAPFNSITSIYNGLSAEGTPVQDFKERELQRENEQIFHTFRRGLINKLNYKTTEFDSIDPPTTTFPTTPVTNPVTTPALGVPAANQVPTVVTIPATNPGAVSPNPTTNPVTIPSTSPVTVPVTNPVNSPMPVTNPVTTPSPFPTGTPTTNPVTTNPPTSGGVPVTTPTTIPPPATGNPPAVAGQSWCIGKNGASQAALQAALDYACGIGGADCATIQQGANCYNPNTLQNHASYAFNSYYQKNPVPTSCDFGGAAAVTTTNPSESFADSIPSPGIGSGSCIYPSSSSSSSSPATVNPTPTPTPTTASSSGSSPVTAVPGSIPPPVVNSGSGFPDSGTTTGFGASPPLMNSSVSSVSAVMQPFISYLVVLTSITTGRFILDM